MTTALRILRCTYLPSVVPWPDEVLCDYTEQPTPETCVARRALCCVVDGAPMHPCKTALPVAVLVAMQAAIDAWEGNQRPN